LSLCVWDTSSYPYERRIIYSYDGGNKFRSTNNFAYYTETGNYPIPVDISVSPLYGDGVRNIALIGRSGQFGGYGIVERQRFEGERATRNWVDATSTSSTPAAWNWSDCDIVTSIAWSPNFERDNTVLVVTYDYGTNTTLLQHGQWPSSEGEDIYWNEGISGINPGGSIVTYDYCYYYGSWPTVECRLTTGIALPSDYDGNDENSRRALVYVDSDWNGTGVIYSVDERYGNVSANLFKHIAGCPYLASLAYCGDIASGKAVAGVWGDGSFNTVNEWDGVQVYRNGEITDMNTIRRWIATNDYKLPSGIGPAIVSYATPAGNKTYALTAGAPAWWWMYNDDEFFYFSEGALSVSFNDGESWNQIGLINTDIGHLTDAAMAPDCNTTFVASTPHYAAETWDYAYGYCNGVWLMCEALPEYAAEYNGKWMRVWYGYWNGYLTGLLRLAPEETTEISNVYYLNDSTSLFYTESKGLDYWDLDTKCPFNIVDLAATQADVVYAISDDGRVAMFDGTRWPSSYRVYSGLDTGNTIAVFGDNVLVGGKSGDVSYSSDGGLTFTELEDGLPLTGDVFVAFDSYFSNNSVVYAAVNGSGIYRWVVTQSVEWEDIGAGPLGYTGIVLDRPGNPETSAATGGVLYAAYYNATTNQSGVARCLTPAGDVYYIHWDYLEEGLNSGEAFTLLPSSLKICGCLSPDTNSRLFAIDACNPYYNATLVEDIGIPYYDPTTGRLWRFEDYFAKSGPVLTSPADSAIVNVDPDNCWNNAFALKWVRQGDACKYDLQIAYDPDFAELVDVEGNGGEPMTSYEPPNITIPSYVVPNKGLGAGSCGTTFYWRVRCCAAQTGQEIHSPWSESRSFTVGVGVDDLYGLAISSTSGGSVTTPGEGLFGPYAYGTVVNLTAEAEDGYHFVNWTGDVSTIAEVNSRTTNITIQGAYSITANFAETMRWAKSYGGSGGSVYYISVDMFKDISKWPTDSRGDLKQAVEVNSTYGEITISLGKGTTCLGSDGKRLENMGISETYLPLLPEGYYIIGKAYKLEPSGAIFNPAFNLTIGYEDKVGMLQ